MLRVRSRARLVTVCLKCFQTKPCRKGKSMKKGKAKRLEVLWECVRVCASSVRHANVKLSQVDETSSELDVEKER